MPLEHVEDVIPVEGNTCADIAFVNPTSLLKEREGNLDHDEKKNYVNMFNNMEVIKDSIHAKYNTGISQT